MEITKEIEAARLGQGPKCRVRQLLTELEPGDSKQLADALANPAYQHAMIARGMTNAGELLRADAVMKHRNGSCSCGSR